MLNRSLRCIWISLKPIQPALSCLLSASNILWVCKQYFVSLMRVMQLPHTPAGQTGGVSLPHGTPTRSGTSKTTDQPPESYSTRTQARTPPDRAASMWGWLAVAHALRSLGRVAASSSGGKVKWEAIAHRQGTGTLTGESVEWLGVGDNCCSTISLKHSKNKVLLIFLK